jgi:hypothetical protein
MYDDAAENWETTKEEMGQVLVERASPCGMILNSDLVSEIEPTCVEPDSFALAHTCAMRSLMVSQRPVVRVFIHLAKRSENIFLLRGSRPCKSS